MRDERVMDREISAQKGAEEWNRDGTLCAAGV